ncbi:MAG: D-alanine--D-alanine ligase [Bacteroidia bacterium]
MKIPFAYKLKWHRLTNWEYWPAYTLYIPILPYICYLAIKAGGSGFFQAANPGIKYGGLSLEGKSEIEKLLPNEYNPKSILLKEDTSLEKLIQIVNQDFTYPFILKPNDGCRGKMVSLIHTDKELISYFQQINFDFLIQEYVSDEHEIGLFYVRYPNQKAGRITGIVYKHPVQITGDGIRTVEEIVANDFRYHPHQNALFENNDAIKDFIPSKNQSLVLSRMGNHCKGSRFEDISYKISPTLSKMVDQYCQQIEGFYYGRFDIKYNNWEEFESGKSFKVIELNGAGAEPTHIYDSKHSYFFALKEMAKHWRMMSEIAVLNKKNGHAYIPFKEGIKLLKFVG